MTTAALVAPQSRVRWWPGTLSARLFLILLAGLVIDRKSVV